MHDNTSMRHVSHKRSVDSPPDDQGDGYVAQPKRRNFIARRLSYHGNTVATLALGDHPARRTPYEAIIDHDNFHHVSPAYAARYQKSDETEEQYVGRLAQELEDKFQELGPQTVIGCERELWSCLCRMYLVRSFSSLVKLLVVAETVVGATTGVVPPPKGTLQVDFREEPC